MTVFEDKLRERPTLNVLQERGTARIVELTAAERDALADAIEAARTLHHFLWEEKTTCEPSRADLDLGYVALESSADYEREEQLGEKLMDALARLDAA